MPRKKNIKDTIQHKLYRNAHLYNRDGVIYTHIRYEAKKYRNTTNLVWHPDNFEYALNILEQRIQKIQNPHPEGKPFNEIFEQFLNLKTKYVSKDTLYKYRLAWRHFITKDYTTNGIELMRQDIATNIANSKLSNNTISKQLQLIEGFFNYCIEHNYIPKSPVTSSMIPPTSNVKVVAYTDEEVKRIISYFPHNSDMNLLLRIIANTGMRVSEAVNLKRENILVDRIIIIGKGNIERFFPIQAGSELEKICTFCKKRETPFTWTTKRRPERNLLTALKKLKINTTGFHPLRKYFENKLIDSGVNIKVTAQLLGHTTQIQSKHYVTQLEMGTILNELNKAK